MTMAIRRIRIMRWEPTPAGYILGFTADSRADFDWALAVVKGLPPEQRRWLPNLRCWWVGSDAAMTLIDRFPPLWEYLADRVNADDHYQGQERQRRENQRTGPLHRQASDWGMSVPAHVRDAFALLHLTPSAPPELVAAARRVLARLHHPDFGGDHLLMVDINRAADIAEQWLADQAFR